MSRRVEIKGVERPPGFVFHASDRAEAKRGEEWVLHCGSVALPRLAEKYGTPLYVYSAATIRERLQAFKNAFRAVPHTICYSVKANSNLSVLRLLARAGCGFDVVSGGELERVHVADARAAKKVVFSGVGKTRVEMIAALRAGILIFNVESAPELETLAECAAHLKKTAKIALRVNPDVAAETHPYISTGLHRHKFGVPIRYARALYAQAAKMPYVKIAGVSVHIGSQIRDAEPFGEAITRVAELVRKLRQDGHDVTYVDAGGGLGIGYEEPGPLEFADSVARYAKAIIEPLRGLKVHLLLEPGRSIVGPAGALITTVLYKKANAGKRFVVVDAAMNDLIRPTLYGAYHEIVSVVRRANSADKARTVDVVGPVCESGDFFARDRELPLVEGGDLLAILDAGAYGMALSSNYNTRPKAAEILVSGTSARIIRRRERIRDLYTAEI
jgi:diaminopimelate decarboxylase